MLREIAISSAFINKYLFISVLKRTAGRCHFHRTGMRCWMSSNFTKVKEQNENLEKIRNIGIMAHIDAGKTTTTERMLFYSGFSRILGDVDDGDTVTDYLQEERERGITIVSAAITFNWLNHKINLIDTPGHVDFTMEVERALRVLDGTIAILDATSGVEAQTVMVWRQAHRYNVPRIIYLNKMDRSNASVALCLKSIEEKLETKPLLIHLPVINQSKFAGVVDLLHLVKYEWLIAEDPSGRIYKKSKLKKELHGELFQLASTSRQQLVESIADLDDTVAELFLLSENHETVSAEQLESALRRLTLSHKAVPVLCGSSYKNIAVQLLLDALIKFLPSPSDCQHDFLQFYQNSLCSLAFKITHDQGKGRLTFVRVYSGRMKRGQSIYNAGRNVSERINKLYIAYADQLEEVEEIGSGNIAVLSGLTTTCTGDTLVSNQKEASEAVKKFQFANKGSAVSGKAILAGVEVPQPVFFCSIEPASLAHQTPLENALKIIQAEDPSFSVKVNEDTGQTIIAGMGELHIEIIKHRIENEFKVDIWLGPLQVAYHETIFNTLELKHTHDKTLGNIRHKVDIHLTMEPDDSTEFAGLLVAKTRESRENIDNLKRGHFELLNEGVKSALMYGSLLGCPVTNVQVKVHWCEIAPKTSPAMITAAAAQCVHLMLKSCQSVRLMEPIMLLEIVTNEKHLHAVLSDLNPRRGEILHVYGRSNSKIVSALVPLAEIKNYSTSLRIITSGTSYFSMTFHSYQKMSNFDQQRAVEKVTGISN